MDIQEIAKICRKVIASWCDTNIPLGIKKLPSGTNHLYSVTAPINPYCCIFREFGIHKMLNRQTETQMFDLMSQHGIGPNYYIHTDQYRVEESIRGAILTPYIPRESYIKKSIRKIAMLHDACKSLHSNHFRDIFLQQWLPNLELDYLKSLKDSDVQDYLSFAANIGQFMKRLAPASKGLTCYSHNDISLNNMILSDENDIVLIDFEYSSINDRGYDLACLFEECISDYDWPFKPNFRIAYERKVSKKEANEYVKYYHSLSPSSCGLEELIDNVDNNRMLFNLYAATWGLLNVKRLDWASYYFKERWHNFRDMYYNRNI